MARVTLLGIPPDLSNDLTRVLVAESHKVNRKLYIEDFRQGPKSAVVFVSGDNPDFRETIAGLREAEPALPVVVVTRMPETGRWLDALDAGAADYCGAPFERVQVRWIMSSVLNEAERRAA
jgi:DNA-binding response OmpR family regulator